MGKRFLLLVLCLSSWLAPLPALSQAIPIFDAHIHYSEPAWSVYPPQTAFAILDRGGVTWAVVSSTPDDGTLKLYEHAPGRIIPFLRPYRTRGDMGTWTDDLSLVPYLEERLKRGIYKGIGEFHLGAGQANAAVVRRVVELAAASHLFLYPHADEVALEELIAVRPGVRVLWAHAGMTAPPAAIERILDRHPHVWVELSYRFDVAPGGRLDPTWRALFLKHPDRFMVGTDTWSNAQWERLPEILETFRAWLRQLPDDVAEKIAHGNASRLFGSP